MSDDTIERLIQGSIDMHVHCGPDAGRTRHMDAVDVVSQAKDAGMKAIVLKSHDYITTPVAYSMSKIIHGINIFGGVVLNSDVGGLNLAAVEMAAKLGSKIIWMPTFSSENDMRKMNKPEKGISILKANGELESAVPEILESIKANDLILASGHLSTNEIFVLIDEALGVGIEKIVVTHPLTQRFGPTMSIEDQNTLAKKGAYIEHCFVATMPAHDKLDPLVIAEAIKTVGAKRCILSTDFGQDHNPPPVEGMRMMISTMLKLGLTESEIHTMVKTNPGKLLDLE